MRKIIEFCKKHETIVYLLSATILFITFFIPYVHMKPDTITPKNVSLFILAKQNGFIYFILNDLLFFLSIIALIFSAFSEKNRIFAIIKIIAPIVYFAFFIGTAMSSFKYYTFTMYQIFNNTHVGFAGVSFYIWILFFIIDCIYLFIALQKAFPFKKKEEEIDSDKDNT